jgi:hypothetical protein
MHTTEHFAVMTAGHAAAAAAMSAVTARERRRRYDCSACYRCSNEKSFCSDHG